MADEDLKYPLKMIEELNPGLQKAFKASNVGNEKNHGDLVNKFVQETKKHYQSFNDPDRRSLMKPEDNMKMLYQDIGEEFKDLVNKLGLNQSQKDEATQIVAKYTNLALESTGFTPLSSSSAGKIIAEDAHKDYQAVVDSLPMTNKNQMEAQVKYKGEFDRVISDPKRGNILDEIAKLHAKLQKDLNLNDRQINELNIGAGHYIHTHQKNFASDLKDNMSREDITNLLNEKTAKSAEKLNQTRAQAAKSVVVGAGKRATKTVTSQWQNPSKSEATLPGAQVKISQKREKITQWKKAELSDKNPKIAVSGYRKSQEISQKPSDFNEQKVGNLKKGKQNNVISKLQNISETVKNVATKPTERERQYDAAVRGIEADVKAKATQLKRGVEARLGKKNHKIPPKDKEYATKLGQDTLNQVKAKGDAEKIKGVKNRIKTFFNKGRVI